jgi:ligand-binding sensor domain-containing protein/signal transduction histidine kinase
MAHMQSFAGKQSRVGVSSLLLALAVFTGAARAERLPIKNYTTADGLPRDHINRIVQDSRGFIWFCTTEGLSRFDGYKFTNYGREQGLPGRQVFDLLESRAGVYWVATDKGLCRLIADGSTQAQPVSTKTGKRFAVYYPGDSAEARFINVLFEDRKGTLWCGTDLGLFRADIAGHEWVFSFVDIVTPSNNDEVRGRVRSIIEDRFGCLWVGAEYGLYCLHADGTEFRYTGQDGLPEKGAAAALVEDREGRIWVASNAGVYELSPGPLRTVTRMYTTKDGLASNFITALHQSSNGRLLVGTQAGLGEFVPQGSAGGGRFKSYTTVNGLNSGEISAIAEDRDNNLWVGTWASGAIRIAANGFATYTELDGLASAPINSIFEARSGDLCVGWGTAQISKLDSGKFIGGPLALPKGMSYWGWGWNQITFQDSAGEWWMSTGEGLVRYPRFADPLQVTHARPKVIYTTKDGLGANEIFRLFEDSRGDIWISTLGNPDRVLTRWERKTESFHRYGPADGIPRQAPTAFREDGAGNLWIGFYVNGLLRYRAGRFRPFGEAEGVPQGLVRALYLDRAGRLWVATNEGGVARADRPSDEDPTFVTYSTADGLSSNQATCITEDGSGMLYIGTGRGLDRLDPVTGHIKHYTTADGLANSFINVSYRDRHGSLWFGTLHGLSRLVPSPEPAAPSPPIFISAVRIGGVDYNIHELGEIDVDLPELAPNQNSIQIDFTGLSLITGETLRYQYKLEGSSPDWSAPVDGRTVNYPDLAPGTYSFLVRAIGSSGETSERPAIVSFKILPPYWRRWWVQLAALIAIAIPIGAVVRYRHDQRKAVRDAEMALRRSREERLAELEQVRKRIATDLHDDVGSSLTHISILSEVARQETGGDDSGGANSGDDDALAIIARSSRELVDTMSDIVWAINPQRDHLSDLTGRMRRFASDVLTGRNIAFEFHEPDEEDDVPLGANIRREVFLIFKESVNNLVRHSGCTSVQIDFEATRSALKLRVHDNGRGFDPSRGGEGHGLASMRERAQGILARLEIVSRAGEGTTITVEMPLKRTD